jgi:hypothetical protein
MRARRIAEKSFAVVLFCAGVIPLIYYIEPLLKFTTLEK